MIRSIPAIHIPTRREDLVPGLDFGLQEPLQFEEVLARDFLF